jgi:hypothetical protein
MIDSSPLSLLIGRLFYDRGLPFRVTEHAFWYAFANPQTVNFRKLVGKFSKLHSKSQGAVIALHSISIGVTIGDGG